MKPTKELIYFSVVVAENWSQQEIQCAFSIPVNDTFTPDEILAGITITIAEKINRNSSINIKPENIRIKLLSLLDTRPLH